MTRLVNEAPDEGDQREVAPNHHARHPPGRLGAHMKPLLGDLRQVLREGEQRRRLEHVIHDDAPERPRQLGDAPRLEAARPLDQPLARRRVGQHAVLLAAGAHEEQAGDAQQQHAEVGERGDPERPGQVAGALGDDVGQRLGHQHAQLRRRQLQPERQREAVVRREPRREEAVARGAVGRVAQRQRAGAQQHQAVGAGLHGGADDDGADDADGAGDDEGGGAADVVGDETAEGHQQGDGEVLGAKDEGELRVVDVHGFFQWCFHCSEHAVVIIRPEAHETHEKGRDDLEAKWRSDGHSVGAAIF